MRRSTLLLIAGSFIAVSAAPRAQAPADAAVARVRANAAVVRLLAALDRDHDRIVADTIALTEIPAPPFKEAARGAAFATLLREAGLTDVARDAEGNVTGLHRGTGGGPLVAIAAHLDTVFPEGTDVRVKRSGTRLSAPGVGDDARGLALVAAIARAMSAARVDTASDILFVGDVGEEGAGDLHGVRFLFTQGPYKTRITQFISIDGAGPGDAIVNGAVGSRRYRVTFKGPGGHSYSAFGLVNPAYALAGAMAKLAHLTMPRSPRTTFNVGVVGGGTSVNSIPSDVWMEVDLRSEAPAELDRVEQSLREGVRAAVAEENASRSIAQGRVTAEFTLIGSRPAGSTPPASPLVTTAEAVVRALNMKPVLQFASTDANVPMSLGIPAVTIESGGDGARAHAADEWIDVEKAASLRGIDAAAILLTAVAGVR